MLCHSHPVQTNTASATAYLGDPSCPLAGSSWAGGGGMAVMPCPISSISWVKRLGLVAWWGRRFLVAQTDSWTLGTPLLRGALPTLKFSQWINQGSGHVTYQVTENPGLAQPQAPVDTQPCVPCPKLLCLESFPDTQTWSLLPAAYDWGPPAPLKTPPLASQSSWASSLWCGPTPPSVPKLPSPHPTGSPSTLGHTHREGSLCCQRQRWPTADSTGTGPQTQQTQPRQATHSWALRASRKATSTGRWGLGLRRFQNINTCSARDPQDPHTPRQGWETFRWGAGWHCKLHQMLIRAVGGGARAQYHQRGGPQHKHFKWHSICV